MASGPILAPSILSADFARLGEQIAEAEEHGAAWLHIDVMDGHFVPPISMGQVLVEAYRRVTKLPLDVHLMVREPEKMLASFAEAGADHLTVHVEAVSEPGETLEEIRRLGCKAGLALNPDTPAEAAFEVLPAADILLAMTVHPGYSGQAFLPEVMPKVAALRQKLDDIGSEALIEVDGGIDAETLPLALEAGAQVFVAASAVYGHAEGIAAGMQALQEAARLGMRP